MHPTFQKGMDLTKVLINAAIEVHRDKGPVPVGLLLNFNEVKLVDGVHRLILPGANR